MKSSKRLDKAGVLTSWLRRSVFGLAILAAGSAVAQSSVDLDATGYDGVNGGANCPGLTTVRNNIATPLTYCYVVSNTGATQLSNLVLSDQSGFTTNIASLAAGQVLSFFRETIITGDVANVVNVTGDVPGGGQVSSSDEVLIDAASQCPVTCFIISDVANPGGPDQLYTFNITNGVSSLIAPVQPDPPSPPNANCLEALTFALPETGNISPLLYSVDAGPTCGTAPGTENQGFLGTLDWDTSNAIPDGRWTPAPFPIGTGTGVLGRVNLNNVDGLDFDATQDGVLYAVQRTDAPGTPDILFQIDATTGQVVSNAFGLGLDYITITPVTNSSNQVLADIDDIAIGTFDGVMYGIANASGTFDELVLIDKFTGDILGNYPLLAPDGVTRFQDMEGMSFDPIRGELYGSSGTAGGATANSLFKINILPPILPGDPPLGRTTLIGPIPGSGDYEGSDCFLVTPDAVSTLEGVVFWDPLLNGVFSGVETPVENATVELWNDVDQNGVIDPLIDFISRTEVTGPDGRYVFTVIINQEYIIRVDQTSLPIAACGFTTLSTAAVAYPNLCGVTLVAPDFGIAVCKALGDFVWDDVNQNGVQDPGEPGIENVTVNLLDINNVQITNTVTDSTGFYIFPTLVASNWVVEVVPPAGYDVTAPDAGGDTVDSDINIATLRSPVIPLFDQAPPGVLVFTNDTVDAGLFLPNDVAMLKTAGYPVAGTGNVTFDYTLAVTNLGERVATAILVTDVLPVGLDYVSDSIGGSYTPATRTWTAVVPSLAPGAATNLLLTVEVTNAVATAVANTACVEIALPETSLANNCSTNLLGVLGDFVWRDVNGNGLRDPIEISAGVPGVTVTLTDAIGTALATTVTDASGIYLFNVPAGEYAVTFAAPSGVNFTTANTGGNEAIDSDADTGTGATAPVTIAEGGINLDVDAGLLTPTDITKDVGAAIASTGNVRFSYVITVTNLTSIIADPAVVEDPLPAWASYVSDDAGGTVSGGVFTVDVGPLPPNGSRVINVLVEVIDPDVADDLSNTATVNQAAFAAQTNAFIGDLVFQDMNNDAVFGPGDLPVPGATVNLYDASGAVQLGSTTTDGSGLYGFIVPPGTYTVGFVAPPGSSFVAANQGGNEAVDSDADETTGLAAPVTVAAGDVNLDLDAGVFVALDIEKTVSFALPSTGLVTYDYLITVSNSSALVVNPVVITDELPTWAAYVSDDAGGSFAGGIFTANIGALVPNGFRTVAVRVEVAAAAAGADLVNTAAANTIYIATQTNSFIGDLVFQDADFNDVQSPGDTPVSGVTVNLFDFSGSIQVGTTTTDASGLYGFIVPPGQYTVQFVEPAGMNFVAANVGGNEAQDSDANVSTGRANPVTVVAGESNRDVDAGLYATLDIDKTVSAALPSAGQVTFDYQITVSNTSAFVVNPVVVNDPLPAWATYLSDSAGGSEAAGVYTANLGALAANASTTITVRVEVSAATAGADLVNTARVNNLFVALQTNAYLGDLVFQDSDLNDQQSPGDLPVPGATVNLYDASGATQLGSTTTDASGNYGFIVPPGTYTVGFTAPAGTRFVTVNTGAEAVDSDADETTGRTAAVTLAAGETNLDLDAGVFVPVDIVKSVAAPIAGNGLVTFDYLITVSNTSALVVNPATVTDALPVWATYLSDDAGGSFSAGLFTADVGPLAAGASRTIAVRVEVNDADPAASLVNTTAVNSIFLATQTNAFIGDYVFLDVDGNDVQSPGDLPVIGVPVNLYDSSGTTQIATTNTDGSGAYGFIVPPGTYVVGFTTPAGATFVAADVGGEAVDSDANAATGRAPAVTVAAGEVNRNVDAGIFIPVVFEKFTRAAVGSSGPVTFDYVIAVVNSTALPVSPAVITDTLPAWATYISDNAGGSFAGGVFTANLGSIPANSSTAVVVRVEVAAANASFDLVNTAALNNLFFATATNSVIGDLVFVDNDYSGTQNAGDTPVPNATVRLFDASGVTQLGVTNTTAAGEYFFIVPPGDYTVRFDPPANAEFTTANVGADDAADSDADTGTGLTSPVTLAAGVIDRTLDAGVLLPIDVTKAVSAPLPGSGPMIFDYLITVSNTTALAADPVDVRDPLPLWATYVSDDAGGSAAGGIFTASVGPLAGNATRTIAVRVSSDNPGTAVDLVNTAIVNDVYIAVQTNAVIGDYVFQDANRNGVQDAGDTAVPGALVTLYHQGGNGLVQVAATVTGIGGNYSFVVPPGTYVVEFTAPVGSQFTAANAGGDNVDSDADVVTGRAPPVTVVAGEVNTTIDAGVYVPTIITKTSGAAQPSTTNVVFEYIIAVTNNSPLVVNPAVIRDPLPTWATYISDDSAGVFAGGELTVDVGPLAGNGSATVRVLVSVDPARGVVLVNTAIINDITFATDESSQIGDYVFLDVNENGVQDGPDSGVSGVTVELYEGRGTNQLGATVTDAAGLYSFIVPPGDYRVRFVAPAGRDFTTVDNGGDDVDSDAAPDGFSPVVSVAAGEVNNSVDAGLISLNSSILLQKTVVAGNGAPCPGVEFLTATNGAPVTYCFVVTNTGESSLSNVTLSDNDITPVFSQNIGSLGIGLSVTVSVSRVATLDLVNTGSVVGTPPSGPPVTDDDPAEVDVINPDLAISKTVYLGHNGGASCQGVELVTSTNGAPVTYCFVVANTGDAALTNVAITDSDISPAVLLNIGNLAVGQTVTQFVERVISADLVNTAIATGNPPLGPPLVRVDTARVATQGIIGDFVWDDLNGNGVQDSGEPGLNNVQVVLLNSTGNPLVSTFTGPTGLYQFTGLVAGTYAISVTMPPSYLPTTPDVGLDSADSDINPATGRTANFVLTAGQVDRTRDAGLLRPGGISGQVREDQDSDGDLADADPPVGGVTIRLFPDSNCDQIADGPVISSTTTTSLGNYAFVNLRPGCYIVEEVDLPGFTSTGDSAPPNNNLIPVTVVSGLNSPGNDFIDTRPVLIGDFVWEDLNGNGLQDVGEPGIPNVTVTLLDSVNAVVATTTTSGTGAYAFSGLSAGTYRVRFDLTTVPAGFVPTIPTVGPDEQDSDADASGQTRQITLTSGQTFQNLDMGAYQPVTLGDYVWRDQNGNALQDADEPPVSGVGIIVYETVTATAVGSAVTGTNGAWQVSGLRPGSYYVAFETATFPAGTLIAPRDIQPGNDVTDSDADPATGLTDPTGPLPSGTVNNDIDLGLQPLGFIGDTVWEDVNADGIPNENLLNTGIPNVVVRLYSVTGGGLSLVDTTTTSLQFGNAGYYAFSNLTQGVYVVALDNSTIPAEFTRYSTQVSYQIDLTAVPSSFTNDFGLYQESTAIELAEFGAVIEPTGVKLTWRTASETDNFGFNVYRSERLNGARTKVNASLVEGQGTGSGSTYTMTDFNVAPGKWFYWLEDVDYDGTLTIHGPVIVTVPEARTTDADAFLLEEPGVYSLAPVGDGSRSQVEVDGIAVASALVDGRLLFYVGEGASSARVVDRADPLRMEEVDVAPQGGELAVVEVEETGSVVFSTVEGVESYLVIGFDGDAAVLLDITDPALPRLLVNFGRLSTGGDSAAYLSPPAELPARIHAVKQQKVKELAP
jgi:uncharacterized repeat protein (TIGR01451 family)